MSKERLLQRLDEIGLSLAGTGHALALLALGSVGTEPDRIDAYSDLDILAVPLVPNAASSSAFRRWPRSCHALCRAMIARQNQPPLFLRFSNGTGRWTRL